MELVLLGISVASVAIGVSIYPAFKVIPFSYGSARLRSAKSKLFKDEELKALAARSYKDILYQIEKKGYSRVLEHIESDFREEHVQRDLRGDSIRNIKRVMDYMPKRYHPYFNAILRKFDYHLITSVFRSKINPDSHKHIIKGLFFQTTYFGKKTLEDIESLSLDDFLHKLKKTPYYALISEYINEIKEGNLRNLELAINKRFYIDLKRNSRLDPSLIRYTRLAIDTYNIRLALTFEEHEFIDGGSLDSSVLNKLRGSKNIDNIKTALEGTPYYDYIKDAKKMITLIKGLWAYRKDFAKGLFKEQPLSINPFLGYYILREIEIKNIRTLLKLVHARFDQDDIREVLI
jgi:vacuolar-type H+-ATPase subunit C/Vma6